MLKYVNILIVMYVISSFATGKITNYAQTNKINDIQASNGKIMVFTGGGVYTLDLKTGGYNSEFGTIEFPDPNMTASCIDDEGTVWVGSSNGYLNSWNPQKLKWNGLVNSYQSAGWKITSMISYGPYLIIGSSKGVSLFDRREMRARKNASKFGDYIVTNVKALAISNDKLYVGLEDGVVFIDSISKKLNSYNFFDPGIWKTDSTRSGSANAFLTINDSLFVFNQPAVVYNGMLLEAKGTSLMQGENVLFQIHDSITCLKTVGSDCWVGTTNDCVYKYNAAELKHFQFEGPTFKAVKAVTAAPNGHAFIVPAGSLSSGTWWQGFSEFTGNNWIVHNSVSSPDMGPMPSVGMQYRAIMRSREGDVWISTYDSHCKRYSQKDKNWSQYCTYSHDGSQGFSSCGPVCPANFWAKSDAVGQDSSGFVWVGCWDNPDGSLICFDPANKPNPDVPPGTPQAHYRRFFDGKNESYHSTNVVFIVVDIFGTIFVAENGPDNLLIMKHSGDPVTNGVTVVKTISDIGMVLDAVCSQSGKSYFLTSKGLYEYDPEDNTAKALENVSSGIDAIEIEDDNILWFASASDGLVRYDLLNKERLSTFNKVDGLVSTFVSDLSLDRENGVMWIATDQGVTRLSIGVKSQVSDIKKTAVFPVPFRKSRNTTINFHYVSPKAEIAVYSLHGSLVGKPVKIISNLYQAQFSWSVPANVSPGTYYYIIKDGESSSKGRLLITP